MNRILHALAIERFQTLEAAASVEEWVLRLFRRRAAGTALRRAQMATQLVEIVHVARVARLQAANVDLGSAIDDPSAVGLAYSRLPMPSERGLPVQSLTLMASILVVTLAVVGLRAATRPFDAATTRTGRALSQEFGRHVADIANGKKPSSASEMSRVFPSGSLAPSVARAMQSLFDAQLVAAGDPKGGPALHAKTRDVNRAFAAINEPWYLDARIYRDAPLLYAFYREREDEGTAAGYDPERVVFLWRVDHLNISKAALGYTHREAAAAMVLYDQIEENLIRFVLPALAEGEKVELVDAASRDPKQAWQEDIETRAARMVRESFAGAGNHDALVELGKLLAERRAIVRSWNNELAMQNRKLHVPTRLIPEGDYEEELRHLVPTQSRHRWEDVHDTLRSARVMSTFEALRDRFADDVMRHELQHRFDAQRTKSCQAGVPCETLSIPEAVTRRVGPATDTAVALGSLPDRIRTETSAYLAEMASGGLPKMTLLGLLPMVLDREAWGDVYCNTMIVLLDVLAAELGLVDEAMPLVRGGAVQRASVSSLVVILFSKSDEELRRAASHQWHELFGGELPVVRTTPITRAKRWRH